MSIASSVAKTFLSPINELLPHCQNIRDCPELPDETWFRLGLEPVLHELPSGRAFLQEHAFRFPHCPPRSNYFESLKSTRRLNLAQELNQLLCQRIVQRLPDPLSQYAELADFDLYAGDGHWHGAAAHDAPADDDTKYAVGHFYALDLRRQSLRHLATGIGKKEHDMHVLKRLDARTLRQHASKGRKVLYVWDKASIDFHAWHRWKQASGVYFVSLEKENMNLEVTGHPAWDPTDPVNAGIKSVELVSGSAGVLVRRIRYVEPVTGTEYVFITNEMTLRPGLIAFLYKLRWDVEKVFDVLKNKLHEQQAWASSMNAKCAQAQLICLLHNLVEILEETLRLDGIENLAEMARKRKVFAQAEAFATAAGRKFPSCVAALQRLTQCSVKLLRWLRSSLADKLAWDAATPRLRELYATL
jgi:Transposase DDE domain